MKGLMTKPFREMPAVKLDSPAEPHIDLMAYGHNDEGHEPGPRRNTPQGAGTESIDSTRGEYPTE
jgi:hypothetical protein